MRTAAIHLILALAVCGLHADDLSAVLRKVEVPMEKAPSQTLFSAGDARVDFVVDPMRQNRQVLSGVESAEQQARVFSQYELSETWALTYETGGGVQRTERLFPEEPALQQQLTAFHRAGLSWRMAKALTFAGSAHSGVSMRQDQDEALQATRYDVSATLKPSEQTNVTAAYARRETLGFDESMVMQDVYSAALGQKLPWVPVTLRSAANYAVEDRAGEIGRETMRGELSGLWAAAPGVELGAGLDARRADLLDAATESESFAYFTQLTLQPAVGVKLNARAASERLTTFPDSPVETMRERLTLQIGASVRVLETIDAGVSVKYPIVDSAPEAGSMLPYISFSATAAF